MINYSIDTSEREVVYSGLAIISASIVSVLAGYESMKIYQLAAPSTLMVFVILISIYDRVIWRYISKLGFSSIPNLNGQWEGSLEKNNGDGFQIKMDVHQTWRKIEVILDTETTTGSLQVANINISNKTRPIVKWVYNLRPRHYALKEGYNPHAEGVNEFRVLNKSDMLVLDGSYYSSQFRGGKIELQHVSNIQP